MTANAPELSQLRTNLAAHHRDAFAWALNCCGRNSTYAEDVLQESYLKVLDGRARFDQRSSFKTWLFGVVRVTAAEQRRQRLMRSLLFARRTELDTGREQAAGADAAAEGEERCFEGEERCFELERALRVLSRRQREVLLLVFYHELTIEDAACVLSIGVGSARQHYTRGKDRLRQLLARRAEPV